MYTTIGRALHPNPKTWLFSIVVSSPTYHALQVYTLKHLCSVCMNVNTYLLLERRCVHLKTVHYKQQDYTDSHVVYRCLYWATFVNINFMIIISDSV